jgi:hypothetical protein
LVVAEGRQTIGAATRWDGWVGAVGVFLVLLVPLACAGPDHELVCRRAALAAGLAPAVIDTEASHGSSRLRIVHCNRASGPFRLRRLTYYLDRAQVYTEAAPSNDAAAAYEDRCWTVFDSMVESVVHLISVDVEYRATGYGAFPYVEGYTFHGTGSYQVTMRPGQDVGVTTIAYDDDNPFLAIEQRPHIAFTSDLLPPTGDPSGP